MAYAEDVAALARLGKLRLLCGIVAITASIGDLLFDLAWLKWPGPFAWALGAACSFLEARIQKRLGRDTDGAILRGVLLVGVAAFLFIHAYKN